MACCNQNSPRPLPDFSQLPDETFGCMARMAYTIAATAETTFTGRAHPTWWSLSEDVQMEYAARAKRVLSNQFFPHSKFDLLFEDILRTMTTLS